MKDNDITLRRSKRLQNKKKNKFFEFKNVKDVVKVKSHLPPKFAYKKNNKFQPRRSERLISKRLRQKNIPSKEIEQNKTANLIYLNESKLNVNESKLNKKDEVVDWSEWIAATQTKNFLLSDGFLDVLQNKSSSVIKANPEYSKDIGQMVKSATDTKSFVPSLMNYGNIFEKKVVELIKKELGTNNTIDLKGNARSTEDYRKTVAAIKKGVPVIFQAVLRNYENKTYGVADILIRSDWINKFLDVNALSVDELRIPSPKLKKKYHYVVIDIKYKTLPLRSDGIHLRNDGNMKAYKSQLCVYNEALAKIQGYLPPYAFILGSKWKYTCKNETFEGNSCFERLGRVDYENLDKEYIEKTRLAVDWIKDVRENEYDLSKYPLERDELYPNMCNRHDYPYHNIKKRFAENNKDLTLLWNVGPKERRIANENGVYTWDDPNCSAKTLGVNGNFKSKVLSRILEANHSETKTIFPKYIENNYGDWKNLDGRKLELFVDFETTCSVFNELEELPNNNGISLIFLIGAGYIHPITKEWTFVKFVVDEINEEEECRICKDFVNFINVLAYEFKINDGISLWHFSAAEPVSWNRFQDRNKKEYELEWQDLLKVFTTEPIGIKGCLSYDLKTVAKNFYKHGFIKTTWDDSGNCSDGADAAVGAFRANLECKKENISFSEHSLAQEIIKYNEVDCRVLMEILYYLRENHVDYSEEDSFSSEIVKKKRKL